MFDGQIFDHLIFDAEDPRAELIRNRRRRRKIVDYEMPILRNVKGE